MGHTSGILTAIATLGLISITEVAFAESVEPQGAIGTQSAVGDEATVDTETPSREGAGNHVADCDRLAADPDDKQKPAAVVGARIVGSEAVAACVAAVATNPDSARLHYQAGRSYLAENDYANAFLHTERASNLGSVRAAWQLGDLYYNGRGVTEDKAKAHALYLKAASAGDVTAVWAVGLDYQEGSGVEKDIDEAIRWFASVESGLTYRALGQLYWWELENFAVALKWYRKASELGDSRARRSIGHAYARGEGVPQDYAEALKWYEFAVGELPDVANAIGDLYYTGKGMPQDYEKARRWYEQGAERGDGLAMANLGTVYRYGKGVPQDQAAAINWFKKAAHLGEVDGMMSLGSIYLDGEGVPKDIPEAITWYRMAAEKGKALAYNQVGWAYQQLSDYKAALEWYKKGADAGQTRAMRNIGWMYQNGQGLRRNGKEALSWYKKAADKGDARAMNDLGVLYGSGVGVERNYREAGLWYEKAAAADYGYANMNLAVLFSRGLGVNRDLKLAVDLLEVALREDEYAVKDFKSGWKNWTPEFLKAFQGRLAERGYYNGALDGEYGSGTLAAIDAMYSNSH
ncbi:TPR repeat protein [Sinorhizobium kostiense]|uniref:TPR repeat protein n=1 Tax=Sinorhizobium kostiense TaxID=76747 RepID=A0ABS4QX73_9HYPH|nr:SEL1-like repeat protein [Sinorhizobium kostiense]MBP2235255.1 TPR repeat protein [Sinorhizobium kostiense]